MEKTDRPYEPDQLFLLSALDQQLRHEMQIELKSIQKRLPAPVRTQTGVAAATTGRLVAQSLNILFQVRDSPPRGLSRYTSTRIRDEPS